MIVGFHPLATQELTEAGQFYEGRARGLGARFIDAAEHAVQLLREHPDIGSPASKTVRSFPVARFPYAVVYRVEAERLFVVAVAHFRRRPKYLASEGLDESLDSIPGCYLVHAAAR